MGVRLLWPQRLHLAFVAKASCPKKCSQAASLSPSVWTKRWRPCRVSGVPWRLVKVSASILGGMFLITIWSAVTSVLPCSCWLYMVYRVSVAGGPGMVSWSGIVVVRYKIRIY